MCLSAVEAVELRQIRLEIFLLTYLLQMQLWSKHGDLELDLFSNSVLDVFIEFLCTN